MNLSFQNRIALYYMVATAIIMAVVFGFVYFIVQRTVYMNLDSDLSYEAAKHTTEINFVRDSIKFINKEEWEEHEHREIQVNPVFIQVIDSQGRLMDKSPNLKEDYLPFREINPEEHVDALLHGRAIRQAQVPILHEGEIKGYILAAMSSESAKSVILKLRNVLLISYLFVLAGLYFTSRFLAGRGIVPIREMTSTINRITRNNLEERVKIPQRKDELYDLSAGFNNLLQRIEKTIIRERQFTSDASHELRTPLAILRGTLEVLIRKPRAQAEYEDKITFSLAEIDRMTSTIEQLLLLARLDTQVMEKDEFIPLQELIDETLARNNDELVKKEIKVDLVINASGEARVPFYYSNLVIENIFNNAIKYSKPKKKITLSIDEFDGKIICTIKDQGIGIRKVDLENLFDNFYRSDALEHKQISGNGLGLSIAKKAADAIKAKIEVESEIDNGTTFTIVF